jgi:hypothetical protein
MEGIAEVTVVVQHYTQRNNRVLGLVTLMGQARKDNIRKYWTTDPIISTTTDLKQYGKPGILETQPANTRFGKASQNTTCV